MNGTVLSINRWASNGDLIADCARLGYLRPQWRTLDVTYGLGTFWNQWRPNQLTRCDLDPAKSPVGYPVDFRKLPWPDRSFECVVMDPPYKLNGRPDEKVDERYGVHTPTRWQDRMALIREGIAECARVLGSGYLLLKCQDQVCSGKKRWQTIDFTLHAAEHGLGLVDRFDFLARREQPPGRRQVHAASCASTLLVFQRGWVTSDRDRTTRALEGLS